MSRRSGLLGQVPQQLAQPQFIGNDSTPNIPRRTPLLQTSSSRPNPNRRSILGDPSTCISESILSNIITTTESWQPPPSILDRAVGILDRTPAEKQSGSSPFVFGSREPLLAEPIVEFEHVSNCIGAQLFGNSESGSSRRGIVARSRTTSPHSVRSSSSPGSSVQDSQSKVKNMLPIGCSEIPFVRPGLLDRPDQQRSRSPPPNVNGTAEPWIAICERISRQFSDGSGNSTEQGPIAQENSDIFRGRPTSARSRSRSPDLWANRRQNNDDKSHSTFSRGSDKGLKSESKRQNPNPKRRKKSRWADSTETTTKDDSQKKIGFNVLDRTAEEKEADALLQFTNASQTTSLVAASSANKPSDGNGDHVSSTTTSTGKPDVAVTTKKGAKKDKVKPVVARKPRIPTGDRRMCVMVTKLTPLEEKLIGNWRYCKFIANTPRVHLTRLPDEVVQSILRRYAEEDAAMERQADEEKKAVMEEKAKPVEKEEQKVAEKQEESVKIRQRSISSAADESNTASTIEKKGEKLKALIAKRKPKTAREEAGPGKKSFLNIPGMPAMESLWNFKIKKKTPADNQKTEVPKQATPSSGSWQKFPPKTNVVTDRPKTPAQIGIKRRLPETPFMSSVKSETEYVSPLMRMEAETKAKRAREEHQERKRTLPRPVKKEVDARPPALLPIPIAPTAADSSGMQPSTERISTVSTAPPCHSNLPNEIISPKGPTPPPQVAVTPVQQRRTLFGSMPLLPTPAPVSGPRTPPYPSLSEITMPSRRFGSLLGDQPAILPNWMPDPPRNGRMPLLSLDGVQPTEEIVKQEEGPVLMADGTPFDPMAFLNRCSDYSSDSDGAPSPKAATSTNDRTNEIQPPTEPPTGVIDTANKPEQLFQAENAMVEDCWPTSTGQYQSEENSNSTASNVAAPTNLDLEAEAQEMLSILRLVERLEKDSTDNAELSNGDWIGSSDSTAAAAQNEEDDGYDVSNLRNIIQMFLDEPTSILQTDQGRRRKAMELLPVLDQLEEYARQHPNAVTAHVTTPIMQFVHEIVELSSTDRSLGIRASALENESGILGHIIIEKSTTTPRNDKTPSE